MIVQGIIK